jgi:hypothetical protein
MIAPKKINSFIALLLITATFNAYSMKRALPTGTLIMLPSGQVMQIVGDIILDNANLNTLLLEPPFEFTELPKDMQNLIIQLLTLETTATSLKTAAYTINSLAQVNKELNNLINNPEFCLQIIKHLAQKFDCTDQEATASLQTPEAKRRLQIQNQLKLFCENTSPVKIFFKITPIKNIPTLESIIEQGADLNFTYTSSFYHHHFTFTPLIFALGKDVILETLCAVEKNKIDINQRDLDGNTALILAVERKLISSIEILLNAGVDPERANNIGQTPLQVAEETGNQEIITLIQDAIDKKHNPTAKAEFTLSLSKERAKEDNS